MKYIEDGEIVAATRDAVAVLGADGERRERDAVVVPWDDEIAEKGGYDSYMLKEIHEQPHAVGETIARNLRDGALEARARRRPRARRRAARPDRRLRHGVPRRPGRGLPDRGVGGRALRRRDRERMALPPAADRRGHARRRDLAVGRDRGHARRPAARAPMRRTDDGDHELARVADHAGGRRRPLHARRDRDRRRRDEDVHVPARAAVRVRAAPRRAARDARRRRARRADGRAALAAAEDHQHARAPGRHRRPIAERHHDKPFFFFLGRQSACRSASRARSSSRRSATSRPRPTRRAR